MFGSLKAMFQSTAPTVHSKGSWPLYSSGMLWFEQPIKNYYYKLKRSQSYTPN